MAYKYTTGSSDTGDLYRDGDTGRNTYINFEEDSIGLVAGGVDLLTVSSASQDKIHFNDGGVDCDFIVESPNESLALYLHAENEVFHINHGESGFKTKIHSTNGEAMTANASGIILNEDGHASNDFRVESDGEDEAIFLDSSTNTFYINKGATAFTTVIKNNNEEIIRVGATGLIVNEYGHASNDFRVESDNSTHMIFLDSGNDKLGINTDSPTSVFHVSGSQAGNYFGIANNTHSPYALDETHHIVHYYGSGNATIELPAVAGCTGRIYHIITNCGSPSDEVTVDPSGAEMISGSNVQNGGTTQLGIDGTDPQSITIVSTGAHWHILSDARAQGEG